MVLSQGAGLYDGMPSDIHDPPVVSCVSLYIVFVIDSSMFSSCVSFSSLTSLICVVCRTGVGFEHIF